jgi:hypothetical protein
VKTDTPWSDDDRADRKRDFAELCAKGGRAWSEADEPLDTEDGDVAKVIDEAGRVEYLNIATGQLTREAVESH